MKQNNRLKVITFIISFSVLIAVLRYFLVSIPNVNPVTALVLIMGIVFGRKYGLYIGILTTIVSSLLTGFGTWVIFQLIAWGMIGYIGGWLGKLRLTKVYVLAPIGFILSFFYGWFCNLEIWMLYTVPHSLTKYIMLCVSSFYFDLAHAVSTFACLLFIGIPLIKALDKQFKTYMK